MSHPLDPYLHSPQNLTDQSWEIKVRKFTPEAFYSIPLNASLQREMLWLQVDKLQIAALNPNFLPSAFVTDRK